MSNDEPNTPKSYNVNNDLPRGKKIIIPENTKNSDVNTSDNNKLADKEEPTVADDIARYLAIGEHCILLLKEVGGLATLELTRSLEAIKINIVLQLLLLPAIFLLYISVALSITYIVHIEIKSIYLTLITLLLSQTIGILVVKQKIKKTKKHIGFQKTSEQIYEVKNEILKSIKQTN